MNVLLSYLLIFVVFLCWMNVLLSDLLFLVVFFYSRMFCSQIHEHGKEHQKGNNFFASLRFLFFYHI